MMFSLFRSGSLFKRFRPANLFKHFRSDACRETLRGPAARVVEQLESRTLLSVAFTGEQTVITAEAGDRVIYCSSSTGNDRNSGLSASAPVATLARAEAMLRDRSGDEMLLKTGDTWHGNFVFWRLSGQSASNPMVLGSYGSGARPVIMSGTQDGLLAGDIRTKSVDHVAIMGLHFESDGRDPARTASPVKNDAVGINFLTRSTDILIENVEVENYAVNINFQDLLGAQSNFAVRRSIIINAWSASAHSQGIYVSGVNGITLDRNYFDHNGWNTKVPGANPTWFNHDAYLSYNNTGCVVTNNIFAEAAGYGLQARSGGIIAGNIFINDPVGLTFGVVTGATSTPGGVTGAIENNVFIGGENIGATLEGGGMVVGNINSKGAVISGNIFTQSISNASAAVTLTFGTSLTNPGTAVGINNLKIQNNILYDWTIGLDLSSGMVAGGRGISALNNVSVTGNEFENLSGPSFENHSQSYNKAETFSGNSYYNANKWRQGDYFVNAVGTILSKPFAFPDPTRSIATYASGTGIGGGTAGFLAKAATQSEQSYNPNLDASTLLAYFRAGFGMSGSTPPIVTSPPPVTIPPVTIPPVTIPPVTIPPVTTPPVTTPPGTTTRRSARTAISALKFDSKKGGLKYDGYKGLGHIDGGDWAEYNQIDFGTGVKTFSAMIAAAKGHSGSIQLRLDSPTGTLIGTLKTSASGTWYKYKTETTKASGVTGVHKLYLVFVGGSNIANIQSFKFS